MALNNEACSGLGLLVGVLAISVEPGGEATLFSGDEIDDAGRGAEAAAAAAAKLSSMANALALLDGAVALPWLFEL